eukprot:TRINITY_DN34524_c0_g1_i1.p1 TRINITY_DN34524_c0_g1~~TRINITY_DN34524_c0_g1_i1.p1  ORF type:complete len:527 (-),score=84.95 TRINITY_DN34524_c0_g1_i1:26-1561(-)
MVVSKRRSSCDPRQQSCDPTDGGKDIELHGGSTLGEIYTSIFQLFVPTFLSRLAFIGMKTTDTALIGHSGTIYLTASSLSDFWTSMSGCLTTDMVLGSLCGQAFGAKNYDAVGIWAQVSVTVFSWVLIPVFFLWLATAPVLQYGLGTDPEVAGYAGYYAIVLAFSLPAQMFSDKMGTFFTSQKITGPSAKSTPLSLVLNLVFGLQFVLGIPFAGVAFGFWACPVVTTLVAWFLVLVFVVVFIGHYKYHEQCYGPKLKEFNYLRDVFVAPIFGSSYYNENIKPKLPEFIKLALPANLSLASDFWRMSAIGFLAGSLGDQQVAVFNASYRLAWMNMTIIGSFSTACVTQLGIALGTGDGKLSKKIRDIGIGTVLTFLILTTTATMVWVQSLAKIFSTDPEVIALFYECRFEMGFMIFFMSFAMHFESLLVAIRKTDIMFKASMVGSWGGQVPGVILMYRFYGPYLQSVYIGVGIGYTILLVLYAVPFLMADLDDFAEKAAKENAAKKPLTEAA